MAEDIPQLLAVDKAHLWHPFSQMKTFEADPPTFVTGAEGIYLHTEGGHRLIDGIASWWVNLLGHRHPQLDAALHAQIDSMAHIMFARFTHRPAVELADALVKISPQGLSKVFYSDNGSTAVEVALKMAFQYWQNRGQIRPLFVCLEGGYHGDTLGAISVGGVPKWHDRWAPLLYKSLLAPSPHRFGLPNDAAREKAAKDAADALRDIVNAHKGQISALILEPLVQGAGGMRIYPASYLKAARQICDEAGIFLIFDEVATGLFRTGLPFAADHAGVTPDLMALSKAVTGGYLPLGVTLSTQEIFDGFYGDDLKTFDHGHSFTGNPLATAVAAETLRIISDATWQSDTKIAADAFQDDWRRIMANLPGTQDLRGIGSIGSISLLPSKNGQDGEARALKIVKHAYEAGLFIRPLAEHLYFLPPVVISAKERQRAMQIMAESITLEA